ncbi:MAG: hypothetical protein K0R90_1409 [Oscillospiraceae bacterium]|nr:hypothetical protein [Oscillospiraceae bacterium]
MLRREAEKLRIDINYIVVILTVYLRLSMTKPICRKEQCIGQKVNFIALNEVIESELC